MTQAVDDAGMEPGPVHPLSRRDRLRAATVEEIIRTARRLLVGSGPEAMSLRAIAKEMGMTAPGLYRYFDSHDELLRHVCANIFTELGQDIQQAIQAGAAAAPRHTPRQPRGAPPASTPDQEAAKPTARPVAACREFRRWSLSHQAEFALLFG